MTMSAASKKTIRRLAPFLALLAFVALVGVAGASISGPEFKVYVGSNFVDANNFLIFQTSTGGQVSNVELGSGLQFTLAIANNYNSAGSFYETATVTPTQPLPPGAVLPTVQLGCNQPTGGCPINAAATSFDFPTISAPAGVVPGTYQISFTASDINDTNSGASPTYNFVISSPAAALAKNQLSANTLMTITISGTKTIYAAMPTAALSTTDSTTSASTVGRASGPITLILNNVGTSTIVVTDGNNTVTLGAGDVIAAAFVSSVTASITDGTVGTLRVGLP
jgi:hypothetical protein